VHACRGLSVIWCAGVKHNAGIVTHVFLCVCVCVCVCVCLAEAAHLFVVGLQYVVEPGDLSQFAQFQIHTLQSTGQLILLWGVQLLQGVAHEKRLQI